MSPNLVVATKTLFSPHKWFAPHPSVKSERKTEHWNSPVPGTYQYVPGRGWSLIAIDSPAATLDRPIPVKYSRVLKRDLLLDDYNARKRIGALRDARSGKLKHVGFFQLDDGTAWVNFLDEHGDFIPGPYKLWCIDHASGSFRAMLKGDDPAWRSSRASSVATTPAHSLSAGCPTCAANSPVVSPRHSVDLQRKALSAPMSPWANTPAQSRPGSVRMASFSRSNTATDTATTTTSSSPRSESRDRELESAVMVRERSSLSDAKELVRRLEAVELRAMGS